MCVPFHSDRGGHWIGRGLAAAAVFAACAAGGANATAAAGDQIAPRAAANQAIAAVTLVVVTGLVASGRDVRLVLLLGAFPLFLAADRLPAMLHAIGDEMVKKGTVIPICSAMGFAFVLRFTGCDLHLVGLLVWPLRKARAFLVPGGILAGYLINTTIVSQAGTAAVLGPILIPLLRAGGLTGARAGAILLLGSSMGGELFNPGAVEIRKLAELTARSGADVVARSARLNLLACATALVAFWLLARRGAATTPHPSATVVEPAPPESDPAPGAAPEGAAPFRVTVIKALVPTIPLCLLAIDALVGPTAITRPIEGPTKILAAMLVGVLAAGASRPGSVAGLSAAFFDGAGYAYSHVISLILAASTFAEGIRQSGLIGPLIGALVPWPRLALLVAALAPWGLAIVCGSGIAPAVSIMEFFVPAAGMLGIDPVRLGILTAMGAHFGRTMSPAAAVVVMSARLSETSAMALIRLVAIPLLCGGFAMVVAALFSLI